MGYFNLEAILLLFLLAICLLLSCFVLKKINLHKTEAITRNSPIDGLRGILALSVFAHHFYITYMWKTKGVWERPESIMINNLGAVAVSLFFLITGFLFLSKISKGNIDWKNLFFSRIKRIVPLFYFVLIFIIIFTLINEPLSQNNIIDYLKWLIDWLIFKGASLQDFDSQMIISGVQWTLIYEWKFYFSLPIIYLIWHQKINLAISILIVIGLLFYIIENQSHYIFALFLFAIPSVIYKQRIRDFLLHKPKLVSMLLYFILLVAIFVLDEYSFYQMILLSILFAFIANGYSFNDLLNNKGLKVLGEISYSIYLLHGIVLYMLFSEFNLIDLNSITLFQYYLLFPFVFIVLICFSLLTYKYIEKPFLK